MADQGMIDKFCTEQETCCVLQSLYDLVRCDLFYKLSQNEHCYLGKITENFKIEIIYLVKNVSHKFVIYETNVEIQSFILFITVRTRF